MKTLTQAGRSRLDSWFWIGPHDEYERLIALFADDVVYHRPGHPPIEGVEALERFYREERPLSDGEHDVAAVVADGDVVAARGRYRGRQDGEPVDVGWADFHRFEGEHVAERHTYVDRSTV